MVAQALVQARAREVEVVRRVHRAHAHRRPGAFRGIGGGAEQGYEAAGANRTPGIRGSLIAESVWAAVAMITSPSAMPSG
ncbi:hypothetical protein MTP03_01450 [Tsukamurella sp. PLM1]|nr:hypothetical protein MTP03_01450 [Tsukamurella sp. PLM1]